MLKNKIWWNSFPSSLSRYFCYPILPHSDSRTQNKKIWCGFYTPNNANIPIVSDSFLIPSFSSANAPVHSCYCVDASQYSIILNGCLIYFLFTKRMCLISHDTNIVQEFISITSKVLKIIWINCPCNSDPTSSSRLQAGA